MATLSALRVLFCAGAGATHTYIHTHIHAYIQTYIHTRTHTHIHTYILTYIHTYTYTYIHTYIHTDRHTYRQTYIHTYTHTYIHTHIHTCYINRCCKRKLRQHCERSFLPSPASFPNRSHDVFRLDITHDYVTLQTLSCRCLCIM